MSAYRIRIENEKTAYLEVENSTGDFGVFSKSRSDYVVGFENSPLFEINHSLVNERWFIEASPDGRRIPRADIICDNDAHRWLRDSCCTDFSIFACLPTGAYRLVKTERKIRFADEVLFGNEWANPSLNIASFEGIKKQDPMLIGGTSDTSIGKQKYYPLIFGGNEGRVPVINQPLLCVILLDYGIVWDGATGFIFFSFGKDEDIIEEGKKLLLLIPYGDSFIIDCLSRKSLFNKKIIDDFIRII